MGTCLKIMFKKVMIVRFLFFSLQKGKMMEFYILPMLISLAVFVTSLMLPAVEFDMSKTNFPTTMTITMMAPRISIISALIWAFSSVNIDFHIFSGA